VEQRPFKWTSCQSDHSYTEGHAPNVSVISSTSTEPTFDEGFYTSYSTHERSSRLRPLHGIQDKDML